MLHCASKAILYDVEMTLGKRIRAARNRARLTQKQLGDALGVTDAAVSSWERDETVPEFDKLPAIIKALKISAKWFISGKGEPPAEDDPNILWEGLSLAQQRQAIRILKMLNEDGSAAA